MPSQPPARARALAAAALVWAAAPAGFGQSRSWTSTAGSTIQAEIVRATASEVVLKRADTGAEQSVPLVSLSPGDGQYVREWLEKKSPASAPAAAAPSLQNWDAPWPDLISGEVTLDIAVVEEDEGAGRFVYQSPHYEYVCDVKLTQNVVRRFAILFEATNGFVRALPFSMEKAHTSARHRILLFETEQTYIENGAPPNSAGVYIGGKDIIMVPLTSLGVTKGAGGYRVDYDKTNKTLPHEIVHQITDENYYAPGARGWFTEGLAEYVAVTPYRSGKFTVRGNQGAIKDFVTAYGEDDTGGRRLGEQIRLPDLKEFFLQDYDAFLENGNLNYGASLLIAYFFFHWDGNEDAANVKTFLKALKQGKTGEEALQVLLAGRTFDQLEEAIAKAWKSRGIEIVFQ